MIRETKNASTFLKEINIKWWSILLTTILSFVDSLSNVLLLLGIGQIVANQTSSNSTKGNILKLFFGEYSSGKNFIYLFLVFLLLKVFALCFKTLLTEQIKTRISIRMIAKRAKLKSPPAKEIKTTEISNLFAKGYIGFFADSFFLLVVFGILMNYSQSIGLLYIAFIGFNIALIKFIYTFNKGKISEARKLKNRYKRKEKLIRQFSQDLHQTDRLDRESNLLLKRLQAFELGSLKKNSLLGIAEAITPLSFFSFLLFVAYSHQFFATGIESSFLEITLLLIYSQGSLRRNMRATRYWVVGRTEISTFLESIQNQNTTDEVIETRYFKKNMQLHGESLISAITYKGISKEKNQILQLAEKLDPSGNFLQLISEEDSKFQQKISHEFLFFSFLIMCELDQSKHITFDHSFHEYFKNLFDKTDTSFLKKTYQCE
jgi:hypothetical protein